MIARRVLLVDDDGDLRRAVEYPLRRAGYEVENAVDAAEALEILKATPVDLVVTDMKLRGLSSLELLKRIRGECPDLDLIVVAAYGMAEMAVSAMRAGAYDYLLKPVRPLELITILGRAVEHRRMLKEIQMLRQMVDTKYGFESLVGTSTGLMRVVEAAARAAPTDATVLIQGETGVGKKVLARAIHVNSLRRERPFVVINCGSIRRESLESELFGDVSGAFAGALTHRQGKVEAADGGTILLSEIGEMPLELQASILGLIQEQAIERAGAATSIPVDVRILASTHRDLQDMVARGTFREDLYYRLAVVPLMIPPLRERRADIPELVVTLFRMSSQKHHRPNLVLRQDILPAFTEYDWPGNVRELQNVVERMVVLCPTDEIKPNDLPAFLNHPAEKGDPRWKSPCGMTLDALEREFVLQALAEENWNQTSTARRLGISRKVLWGRISKYDLKRPDRNARI